MLIGQRLYGGPANTDWNGHGSWIGGNIAGALDGVGINGIAPDVKLVALKISEWCGYAYDSSILDAFYYAADNGIDVVSISFGGYLDRSDPDQDAIYQAYVDAVKYAARKGTVIVAAAGNEHLRIGDGGQVISHGPLTIPGDPFRGLLWLVGNPGRYSRCGRCICNRECGNRSIRGLVIPAHSRRVMQPANPRVTLISPLALARRIN